MKAQVEASFSSAVPQVSRRRSVVRMAGIVPIECAAAALLWISGYPRWRIGIFAATCVCFVVLLRRISWTSRPEAEQRIRWPFLAHQSLVLVLVFFTGGLSSPFLVGLPAAFISTLVATGWTATTRALVAIFSAGVAAMAVAPARVVGPTVGVPWFQLLALGTIVASAMINISHITVQKRAMEASEAALSHARELMFTQLSQRTRDMEKVAASLSHELKNPLQAIKILVQLSAREVQEPRVRDRLHVAESEVERMQALIRDYLSFSRPFDKLQPVAVNLGPLCDEVVAVLRERADACGVSLDRAGDARVEADARRLREALHNLVSNAIDASPRGGSVRIEIAPDGAGARIAVRDSGKGMSPETLAKIGTPFFTTREDGTGLGVALARASFLQHGGSLEYQSSPGSGTTATAILPLKPLARTLDEPRACG